MAGYRDGRTERKIARRAARRPEHQDKYESKKADPADREMRERLAALVAKFNGEEADHA